jgi:hypothetical protein
MSRFKTRWSEYLCYFVCIINFDCEVLLYCINYPFCCYHWQFRISYNICRAMWISVLYEYYSVQVQKVLQAVHHFLFAQWRLFSQVYRQKDEICQNWTLEIQCLSPCPNWEPSPPPPPPLPQASLSLLCILFHIFFILRWENLRLVQLFQSQSYTFPTFAKNVGFSLKRRHLRVLSHIWG